MMQEEIFLLFHCTSKIGDHIATINNTVQKAKDEIDNALLKDKCFNNYLLNCDNSFFITSRTILSNSDIFLFKVPKNHFNF